MQKAEHRKPSYEELEAKVLFLEVELDKLRRLIFGQKRERYVPVVNSEQLNIALDNLPEQTPSRQSENIHYSRRKKVRKQKGNI